MDGFVEKIIRFGKMSAPMHGKHGNLKPRSLKVKKGAQAGLPDGLFSNQKSKFGYILECLAIKDVGVFLWPFGIYFGRYGH
jgi:hypothetical protein